MGKQGFIIKRRSLLLKVARPYFRTTTTVDRNRVDRQEDRSEGGTQGETQSHTDDFTALVINSSQEMAKEITMQLTLGMPGCSIMYAPTIELARWLLARREIDLVVSSSVLPDGGVNKLYDVLEEKTNPPDLVVVGKMKSDDKNLFKNSRYEFAAERRLCEGNNDSQSDSGQEGDPSQGFTTTLKSLGKDIRNDLNNPLQEIVAMVFVAQATHEVSSGTQQALEAIDTAAKNMSEYVNALEEKIRDAVEPLAATA